MTILPPGVGPIPLQAFIKGGSGLYTFIQEITQHTASWSSLGSGADPGQGSKALPNLKEKAGVDKQLWIIEVGSHTL